MNSRKIAIVGAGQSGLHIGIALLKKGYTVTMVNNRTPEEIEKGRVTSSQYMFNMSLENEREWGINFWDDSETKGKSVGLCVANPEKSGEKLISWVGNLKHHGLSIDQRVKFPRWMKEFQKLGGNLIIKDVGVEELEELASSHELVLLAGGKGEIVKMFERDDERSVFTQPQRALALTYVKGMTPNENPGVRFNLIPGVGEYFVFPALTTTGPCEIMVFEGIPGGPMDCWKDIKTPEAHLAKSLEILNTFVPWEAARCKNVKLTDDNGMLSGAVVPTIRKPVLVLPSGKKIFGVADAVCVNDPITGQGSNNASKASKVYIDSILARGSEEYTEAWMNATFEKFMSYASNVVTWTNSLLAPPPPHILNFLGAAGQCQSLADLVANGFSDPHDFFPWWLNPELTDKLIGSHMAAQASQAEEKPKGFFQRIFS